MSKNSTKAYQFTIQNNEVVGVFELKNGRVKAEKMEADEQWSFDTLTNQVTKIESEHGRLETTVYADTDGDGLFSKMGVSLGGGLSTTSQALTQVHEGYKFDVVNQVITAVYEVKRGVVRQERQDDNDIFTLQGADIVKTESEHGVIETTVYSDTNADGIYTKSATTYSTQSGILSSAYHGNERDDRWSGTQSDDYYYGALGNDILNGGNGNDELLGAEGSDQLLGGGGDDILSGGDGDDLFIGGSGFDKLTGGAGSDKFKFNNIAEIGLTSTTSDVIADFTLGDKIDLSAIDAKLTTRVNDAFTFIGTSANLATTGGNGVLWFENNVLFGSNDNDLAAEFQIQLPGVMALSLADIIL